MRLKLLPLCIILTASAALAANINVPAGGDLQAALNSAQPGDTVTLAAGATYVGNFFLGPNPGPAWITIQSSDMSTLPPAGTRVAPAQFAAMPKIVSPNWGAALEIDGGANYYHIIGIEFYAVSGTYVQDLVKAGSENETAVSQLPHDIDFDRDYIHGDPLVGGKRGIALNSGAATVENCYISSFFSNWQDTQAIAGWNGPGPYQITNNYLEAGAENIGFGGAVPAIQGVIPSDILIQHNTFYKPLSWMQGVPMQVFAKNHLELKTAQRVTIDSNTFENNWRGADQNGYAIVFTVRTVNGGVPWAVVNDVKFTNNIIKHAGGGIFFIGQDTPYGGSAGNFLIQNNLWEDISSNWGGSGHLFALINDVNGAVI